MNTARRQIAPPQRLILTPTGAARLRRARVQRRAQIAELLIWLSLPAMVGYALWELWR